MAHEMGHHIFRLLSAESKTAWTALIKGTNYQLDLRDVLAMRKPTETWSDLDKRIKREDPELHLRLEGLLSDPNYNRLDLLGTSSINDYVESGANPVVVVRKHPISGYANKNEEEAFCEAIGLVVGYGPRAVPGEVIAWVKQFVPGFRSEGVDDALFSIMMTEAV